MIYKRGLLYIAILLIFGASFYRMNLHFNRLSRYPYDDEEAKRLIDKYMNDQDIEYIIEYSIAPDNFIDFIQSKYFSVYRYPAYQKLQEIRWDLPPEEIVFEVEYLFNHVDNLDEAIERMAGHSFEEVLASYGAELP